MDYTPQELVVVWAARQTQDGEHVFVGMRLPLLAFALAKRTHAPRCLGLFEAGILRDEPAAELLYTMGDAPNITGALWATGTVKMIGLMAAGEVQLGFIGGAEIDRYGNLNTTVIGNWQKPAVRLPGSGGAADIASLSQRLAIIMQHDRHRLREKVDYVTSPGYGYPGEEGPAGAAWRERVGLPGGGPSALITTLAVFGVDRENGEAGFSSVPPWKEGGGGKGKKGGAVRFGGGLTETVPPSAEELKVIRECDPQGKWTR